ncbi:hypothetical protein PanWU01x14_081160, partial [Parasponia andersonii]
EIELTLTVPKKKKGVNLLHYAKLCTYKKSKTSKTLQLKQNPLHKLLLLISNCDQKKKKTTTKQKCSSTHDAMTTQNDIKIHLSQLPQSWAHLRYQTHRSRHRAHHP